MTLDDILASLFPNGSKIDTTGAMITGQAILPDGGPIHVLGVTQGQPLGVDEAIVLAGRVIEIVKSGDRTPILFLVDSASQRMSKRDELLGLSEYLSHLAKALLLAEADGHRTVSLLYGGSAAGAFIATALSTGVLAALPGAHPAVMDLPSMARVTKLPIEVLEAKAKTSAVFAPGLDNLAKTGAVHQTWDPARPLSEQLAQLLAAPADGDQRQRLGLERGGRLKAAEISDRVIAEAGRV
jgi:malonate decarboxylase gamma subunit